MPANDMRGRRTAEQVNRRLIEAYRDEARKGLRARYLNDPSIVRDALSDFSDTEILAVLLPLMLDRRKRDDAELHRLLCERITRAVDACFTEEDVETLALQLGGGPILALSAETAL